MLATRFRPKVALSLFLKLINDIQAQKEFESVIELFKFFFVTLGLEGVFVGVVVGIVVGVLGFYVFFPCGTSTWNFVESIEYIGFWEVFGFVFHFPSRVFR